MIEILFHLIRVQTVTRAVISSLLVCCLTATPVAAVQSGPTLSGLSISPNHVFGGGTTTGFVSLSGNAPAGGATATLTSNSSALSVPPTVTVAEGATTAQFTITAGTVTQSYVRSITASMNGVNRTAFLTIHPGLRAISIGPEEVTGGSPSGGFVGLHGPAPEGGVTVALSDNSGSITTPPSVFIPAGAVEASFSISTSQVNGTYKRAIFANLNGVSSSNSLTLTHGPRLSSLSISPSTVQGGETATATVTLTGPVPSGSTRVVQITDNSIAVSTQSEIDFIASESVRGFLVFTSPVSTTATRHVTVSMGGTIRIAAITLTP